jgi:hypothetical protein
MAEFSSEFFLASMEMSLISVSLFCRSTGNGDKQSERDFQASGFILHSKLFAHFPLLDMLRGVVGESTPPASRQGKTRAAACQPADTVIRFT